MLVFIRCHVYRRKFFYSKNTVSRRKNGPLWTPKQTRPNSNSITSTKREKWGRKERKKCCSIHHSCYSIHALLGSFRRRFCSLLSGLSLTATSSSLLWRNLISKKRYAIPLSLYIVACKCYLWVSTVYN